MAAAAQTDIEMGTFRQFALPDYLTTLDAFSAVTEADPDGKIMINHDVPNSLIQVKEEDGDTTQTLLRQAGFDVVGETVTMPASDVWIIDPALLQDIDGEDCVDKEPGHFRITI